MGRYVEISKQSQALNEHYYEVISHDHPEIKPFCIGLNASTKKVSFYESRALANRLNIEEAPIATIDIERRLEYQSEVVKDRIPRWLIFLCFKKAKDALLADKFPSNISFQS